MSPIDALYRIVFIATKTTTRTLQTQHLPNVWPVFLAIPSKPQTQAPLQPCNASLPATPPTAQTACNPTYAPNVP